MVLWAAAVAVALPVALKQANRLATTGFEVGGSQSAKVEQVLRGIAPDARPSPLAAVLEARPGATAADWRSAVGRLGRAVAEVRRVTLNPLVRGAVAGAYKRVAAVGRGDGRPMASAPGGGVRVAVAPLTVSVDDFAAVEVAQRLRARLSGGPAAVRVTIVGQGALWAALMAEGRRDLRKAELLAFPLVLILLLVATRSWRAALIPLVLGAATVVVGEAAVAEMARVTTMSVFATNVASMIGLGVAVDYGLFVVARYRQELGVARSNATAASAAMRTAGRAVMASGAAVAAAMAGLLLVGTAALRSLALAAIVVVALAVVAAWTLLPALLRLARPAPVAAGGGWRLALGRPGVTLTLGVLAVAVLALPAVALRTGDGALRQLPRGDATRQASEVALKVAGPGRGSPVKVMVLARAAAREGEVVRSDPEVVHTSIGARTRDGRYVLVVAQPRSIADSAPAKALVRRLRRELPKGSLVGGDSAAQVDFNAAIAGRLWLVGLWVVIVSAVVLWALLRSWRLVALAVAANVLSLVAAVGVLALVFVEGSPGYVDTVVVPVVLAVTFGLSMDYQVFLLSRVRERLEAGDDVREAVAVGSSANGRTIVAAAAIMVAVFAAFVVTGVPAVREIGVGAAVAVAVDATVVRLALVPAGLVVVSGRSGRSRTARRRSRGGRRRAPSSGA